MSIPCPPLPVLNGLVKPAEPEEIPASGRLFGWVFAVPTADRPRSLKDILFWWERRRLAYNLFVCILFMVSFALSVATIPSNAWEQPTLAFAILDTFIVVNIAYTFGWVIQSALWLAGFRRLKAGPILFKTGMIFSVVTVILPILLPKI